MHVWILFVHNHIMCSISGRLSNTWVTVSDEEDVAASDDNICNEIGYVGEQHDVVTVTCDYRQRKPPMLRGKYVTIRRKDNADARHLLNFCEVEVLSCPYGLWVKNWTNRDCSQSCGRCVPVQETCSIWDGYCYSGCQEGYWGDNCNNHCNCQACDRYTGCPTGVSQLNFVLLCFLYQRSIEQTISNINFTDKYDRFFYFKLFQTNVTTVICLYCWVHIIFNHSSYNNTKNNNNNTNNNNYGASQSFITG